MLALLNKQKNYKIKFLGFSVAEAMITLLIVSIAAAAAAPLMSKRNQVTTGNGSRWMLTRDNNNISRTRGKVGIGVQTSADPEAMLDIRQQGNNDLFIINRGNNRIFTIDRNGVVNINIPTGSRANALVVNKGDTETAFIDSEGRITTNRLLTVNNVADSEVTSMFKIKHRGTDTAWINANGALVIKKLGAGASNAIVVRDNSNRDVLVITSDGIVTVNKADGNSFVAQMNGTDTIRIGAKGKIVIQPRTADDDALVIRDAGGNNIFWFKSDGTSNVAVPRGMVSFFNVPCASVPGGGWADVPAAWRGRYPRIVGGYQICDMSGETASTGNCVNSSTAIAASIAYNTYYGDAIRNIVGNTRSEAGLSGLTGAAYNDGPFAVGAAYGAHVGGKVDPGGHLLNFNAARVVPVASENRVKSVGLYMCVRT